MKLLKFSILGLVLLSTACSKDDDDAKPRKNLNQQKVSFLEDSEVISVPNKMLQSENTYAQMAAAWVQLANSMSVMSAYSEIPTGASNHAKIVASNGRSAAAGDTETWVWSDQSGYSIGYQVAEQSNSYSFEIFLKEPGEDWLKYMEAEEKKDRTSGKLVIFDIYKSKSEDGSAELLRYDWTRAGDSFTMTIGTYEDDFKLTFNINTKTGAGDVLYKVEGKVIYEIEWDAAGNGSYVFFDEDGEILDEGEWTA